MDQSALMEIATKSRDKNVRATAVATLTDQAVLASIAHASIVASLVCTA